MSATSARCSPAASDARLPAWIDAVEAGQLPGLTGFAYGAIAAPISQGMSCSDRKPPGVAFVRRQPGTKAAAPSVAWRSLPGKGPRLFTGEWSEKPEWLQRSGDVLCRVGPALV
ncbi:hypothetical protein SAMN02787118_12144 [Streptomyces mirabilis]|jgi:hypothetical protein|uniref:Uncharacterized protein n=1 Tax=Streptomyces mirabilis TaxID=68239 RepID=A0A1I2S012_9ACTN|nr:hypothetical protein SAMN02787118_12144 [Streptomyces mirabilis]